MSETQKIVCLCGKPELTEALADASVRETQAGRIVLHLETGAMARAKHAGRLPRGWTMEDHAERLEELHLAKVELATEILIVNEDATLDAFTEQCLWLALEQEKILRFWRHEFSAEIIMRVARANMKPRKTR